MLVLTRKLMERLFIGEDICVTVVRLEGGQVRLGIDAPREVAVVRAELVPDRQVPRSHAALHGKPLPAGPDLTHAPCEARGNDSRRRGRFR
jgi:carbon storage regulator